MMWRFFRKRPRSSNTPDGSVLLLVVILSALLSGLVLLAATQLALDRRGARYLLDAVRVFYLAESGLAQAQVYLRSSQRSAFQPVATQECPGETNDCPETSESPFDRWIPFEDGKYRVKVYDLSQTESPYLERDSGILLVSTGVLAENQTHRLCLLLDGPPDWDPLAWWEPQ